MLAVLKHRNFAILWLGELISLMGDWVLTTALPFYVYQLTGSTLATGAMFMVQVLPRLFFGSLAGVYVDRWDRRRILIATNFMRGAAILGLLLVPVTGLVWIVYAVGFCEAFFSMFYGPAWRAFLPVLVSESELNAANSLSSIGDNIARIVGPTLGGAMMGLFGLRAVVFADTMSYVIGGLSVCLVAVAAQAARPVGSALRRGLWPEMVEGLAVVRKNRTLVAMFIMLTLATLADAMLTPLLVPLVERVFHAGADQFGWLMTARGIGGLIGGLLVGQFGARFSERKLMAVGIILTAVLLAVIINIPILTLALVALAIAGVPVMAWIIPSQTILQKAVPADYRGRVFGAYGTITAVTMLAGMSAAGFMGDAIGIVTTLNMSIIFYLIAAAVAAFMIPAAISSAEQPVTAPAE